MLVNIIFVSLCALLISMTGLWFSFIFKYQFIHPPEQAHLRTLAVANVTTVFVLFAVWFMIMIWVFSRFTTLSILSFPVIVVSFLAVVYSQIWLDKNWKRPLQLQG